MGWLEVVKKGRELLPVLLYREHSEEVNIVLSIYSIARIESTFGKLIAYISLSSEEHE